MNSFRIRIRGIEVISKLHIEDAKPEQANYIPVVGTLICDMRDVYSEQSAYDHIYSDR